MYLNSVSVQVTPLFIESVSNPKVKAWSTLKSHKGRLTAGTFLAEGRHLVEEAFQSGARVTALLIDAGANRDWQHLVTLAQAHDTAVYHLSPQAFAAVSDTVNPQGVSAVVARQKTPAAVADYPRQSLVLDGVQDPGNVGTLLRTAEAFGVVEVCCGSDSADSFSPKVVRASMGAVFRLSLPDLTSPSYVDTWKSKWPSGQVVVCDAQGAIPCQSCDFTRPTLIVIGSEAHGPSVELSRKADTRVRIPMSSPVESLNAAIAGSIVLYEAYRQQ